MPNAKTATPAVETTVDEFGIEDFVAPEKPAHKYAAHVAALIAAGEGKVSTAKCATADEATDFLRGMQAAANRVNKSAVKRSYVEKDGVHLMSVGVREKITRTRKAPEASAE